MDNEFLTLKEIAKILKVSPVHVQNLIHSGKLKGYKFGGARGMRVQVVDLKNYIGDCQVLDPAKMKKGSEFHMKLLEILGEGRMGKEQALEFLKVEDLEGFKSHEYFQQHKFDKPDVGNLRFDTPSSTGSGAAASVPSAGGGDYEAAVEQIMQQKGCREGEAVRLLMDTPEGQALFQKHWAEVEESARRRAHGQR